MKKLKLYGGYHNVRPISLNVTEEVYNSIYKGKTWCEREGCYNISGYTLERWLTTYQLKRLEKYFCGMSDCQCGSYFRDCKIRE